MLISSHVLAELEEVVDDAVFLLAGETVSAERIAAAAGTARAWRVRVAGLEAQDAASRIAVALAIDPASVAVDRRDALVSFESDAAAAAALTSLVGAGLAVAEFAAATGTLEHTFLDLGTRGHEAPPTPDPVPETEGDAP